MTELIEMKMSREKRRKIHFKISKFEIDCVVARGVEGGRKW